MSHAYIITKRFLVDEELSPEQLERLEVIFNMSDARWRILRVVLSEEGQVVLGKAKVFSEVAIHDLAVEIGDIIDTPDFQRNPSANERTIDMVEGILNRVLGSLPR